MTIPQPCGWKPIKGWAGAITMLVIAEQAAVAGTMMPGTVTAISDGGAVPVRDEKGACTRSTLEGNRTPPGGCPRAGHPRVERLPFF